MRKPYLNTIEALDYIRIKFDHIMSYEALKKHIQRGNLKTKQFVPRGTHLITRGALDNFFKEYK